MGKTQPKTFLRDLQECEEHLANEEAMEDLESQVKIMKNPVNFENFAIRCQSLVITPSECKLNLIEKLNRLIK
jgi:hypothetical protein